MTTTTAAVAESIAANRARTAGEWPQRAIQNSWSRFGIGSGRCGNTRQ